MEQQLDTIEKLQELHYPIHKVDENNPPQLPYDPPCRTVKHKWDGSDVETTDSKMLTAAWRLYIKKSRANI